MDKRKKILYVITKSNWGNAISETHGFPTLVRSANSLPSFTGKLRFPDPLQRAAEPSL